MSEQSELKPCPFCGEPAYVSPCSDHSTAWIGGCSSSNGCPGQDVIWEGSEGEAVSTWNNRSAPVVEVKPLVWSGDADGYTGLYGSGLFSYQIRVGGDGFYRWSMIGKGIWYTPEKQGIDAASTAAQADYESRILSALNLRPASDVAAEAQVQAIEAAKAAVLEEMDIWKSRLAVDVLHTDETRAALQVINNDPA